MGKGRAPCCDKSKVKRGPWSPAEDLKLTTFIRNHGHTNWRALPKQAGLLRCGKSCRLRWINYLRPDVKRGNFTPEEELTIINLHNSFGNKWSKIASYLPGRTDNEIKNVWNTHLKKRLIMTKNSLAEDYCHKTEAKDSKTDYSASASCTATCITSTNEKSEFLKLVKSTHDPSDKENSSSDSSTSSYASHFSNSASLNDNRANEASEFSEFELLMNPDDGLKIEIPLDSDTDFWELFDLLDDPLHSVKRAENEQGSNPAEKLECSKWFRLLENELGLTNDVDHQSTVPTTSQNEEMNLEPEIGRGCGFDYFPMWPSSPQNLGI